MSKIVYNVVAASIVERGKLFAVRRTYGNSQVNQKFELPGGKIEYGEDEREGLIRECQEELDMVVVPNELIEAVDYEYPDYFVRLKVYGCKRVTSFQLKEHSEYRWIPCNELDEEDWAPADAVVIRSLKMGRVATKRVEYEHEVQSIYPIAHTIWTQTYGGILDRSQINYMLDRMLLSPAIIESMRYNYEYHLIYLNGEAVGFYCFFDLKQFDEKRNSGIFLSKFYLQKFARDRGIATSIITKLERPIVLTTNKKNSNALEAFKKIGFRITKSTCVDIGFGYVMDDYIMELD